MDQPKRAASASKHENAPLAWATRGFETIEHFISIGIGIILIVATILVLAGTGANLLRGLREWPETTHAFEVVDKLLFVLMLVEILHTVRASIQSMKLAAEPFLIVGLIASVRRILVVTLEASGVSTGDGHPPAVRACNDRTRRAGCIDAGVDRLALSRQAQRTVRRGACLSRLVLSTGRLRFRRRRGERACGGRR